MRLISICSPTGPHGTIGCVADDESLMTNDRTCRPAVSSVSGDVFVDASDKETAGVRQGVLQSDYGAGARQYIS